MLIIPRLHKRSIELHIKRRANLLLHPRHFLHLELRRILYPHFAHSLSDRMVDSGSVRSLFLVVFRWMIVFRICCWPQQRQQIRGRIKVQTIRRVIINADHLRWKTLIAMRTVFVLRVSRPTRHHFVANLEQQLGRIVHISLGHITSRRLFLGVMQCIRQRASIDRHHLGLEQMESVMVFRVFQVLWKIGRHILTDPESVTCFINGVVRRGERHVLVMHLLNLQLVGLDDQVGFL
mmetsp:Transcript_69760/g.110881  ORF Transcript_69760/g.110881 Transcript_69760/m.110881 type:complete len:235 (-) Transcript_69760:1166-1870(-)